MRHRAHREQAPHRVGPAQAQRRVRIHRRQPHGGRLQQLGHERACELLDVGVQLHGGYGYITEYPIARAYLDARVHRIYGGTNEIMRDLVARQIDGKR